MEDNLDAVFFLGKSSKVNFGPPEGKPGGKPSKVNFGPNCLKSHFELKLLMQFLYTKHAYDLSNFLVKI